MSDSRVFTVANYGFTGNERVVLKSICALSEKQERRYLYKEKASLDALDIAIVNGENPKAMLALEKWQKKYPSIPVILMTSQEVAGKNIYITSPPFTGGNIKQMLDTITVETFHYMPELVIGGDDSDDDSSELLNSNKKNYLNQAVDIKINKGDAVHKILVVDDSKSVLKMMDLTLKALGLGTVLADSVDSAVKCLNSSNYDLIFLDVILPDGDGFEICKLIKQDTSMENVPVIMLTGKSSSYDKLKGKLAGCDDYLTKPVGNEVLQNVLKKYLKDFKLEIAL
jgi:two-component system cell cycle response regulator